MTTLKFGGFWDWTGSISWNLVLCNISLIFSVPLLLFVHVVCLKSTFVVKPLIYMYIQFILWFVGPGSSFKLSWSSRTECPYLVHMHVNLSVVLLEQREENLGTRTQESMIRISSLKNSKNGTITKFIGWMTSHF